MATMPNTRPRSARAVETLHRVDPQFQALCKMLYGEDVEAETVWADVFAKRGPDQADLATRNRENVERRVAQASNVLGLTAGTAALGTAARDPRLAGTRIHRAATRVGNSRGARGTMRRLDRIGPKKLAGAALGLQAANVGGDVITSRVLGRSERKARVRKVGAALVPVATAAVKRPSVLAGAGVHRAPKGGKHIAGGAKVEFAHGQEYGRAVREGFKVATATTPRKIALGGGVLYGGSKVSSSRGSGGGGGGGYDYYGKRDEPAEVVWEGTFAKLDTDQRLAFGWASVTEINGMPVIDKQADYVSTDDIEKAAYAYVLKSRVGGDMHRRNGEAPHHVSDLVESFVITDEKVAKMGLPQDTPRGWWVGFKIHDEDAWQSVKKGERTGFSIHGKGRRQEVSTDSVMGYR